jgi:hypothetical protein
MVAIVLHVLMLIQDMLKGSQAVGKATGADKVVNAARTKVADKVEDAAEAWETSQHPLVYQASSVWDRFDYTRRLLLCKSIRCIYTYTSIAIRPFCSYNIGILLRRSLTNSSVQNWLVSAGCEDV